MRIAMYIRSVDATAFLSCGNMFFLASIFHMLGTWRDKHCIGQTGYIKTSEKLLRKLGALKLYSCQIVAVLNSPVTSSAISPLLLTCVMDFDHRKGCIMQLERLLDLPPDRFKEIKQTIRALALGTLNVDHKGSSQLNALLEIEDQLKTLFPDIFDSTQKLRFARQAALLVHRMARSRGGTGRVSVASFGQTQSCSTPRNNLDISSGNTSRKQLFQLSLLCFIPCLGKDTVPSSFRSQQQATSTSQRRGRVHDTGSHCDGRRRLRSSRSIHSEYSGFRKRFPQRLESGGTNINKSLTLCSSGQVLQVPSFEPSVPNRNPNHSTTTTTSTYHSSDSTPSAAISYMHSFLRNCSPSLEHLLFRFVVLGFQSRDIIREVACNWTGDERRELIERLGPDPNGKQMTELEVVALERGFRSLRTDGDI